MSKKHKSFPSAMLTRMPFRSILTDRPKHNQWVLIAWEMNGYIGYESIFWDVDEKTCQHATMWLPLYQDDNKCGIAEAVRNKRTGSTWPIFKWSEHFSAIIDGKYFAKSDLPRKADVL